jgi:hypothetical protein
MDNDFGLETIKKLKPCIFQYKQLDENGVVNDGNVKHLGFIAQDLNEIFPEGEFAVVKKDQNGYYMINLLELIAPIVKSIQELNIKIEMLQKQLEEIKDEVKC